jgi:hypothetical protein
VCVFQKREIKQKNKDYVRRSQFKKIQSMLARKLSFYPGLETHLDQLLLHMSPGDIIEMCLTFPQVEGLFEVFTPQELRELVHKARAAREDVEEEEEEEVP